MALRARLRALSESTKNNEVYHLVLWEEEGTVSVHPSKELTTVSGENCQIKFGRTYYTGKIACSGKKEEMLLREKEYINGEYLPFESSGNQDLDGKRELDINFNTDEMLTDANEMIGHESEIPTTKVKSKSRSRKRSTPILKEGAKGSQKKERKIVKVKQKSKGKILGHGSGADEVDSGSETESTYCDILAQSTAHDDVTAKDIGSGLVNNATESIEQVDLCLNKKSSANEKEMFEALMKRIESIEKRNFELERRNRHFEYLQKSKYPYSGYPLSGLRAPPVNPPYFPVTPPYLASPLAPHFVTRPPGISASCQSHMAPDLMTTTQPKVDYSQESCSESTTDLHYRDDDSLDNSVLRDHEASVDCYYEESEPQFYTKATDSCYIEEDERPNNFETTTIDCSYKENESPKSKAFEEWLQPKNTTLQRKSKSTRKFALKKNATLQNVEKKPLPPIDHDALITPAKVLHKYPQLISPGQISTFAVRLCKEA